MIVIITIRICLLVLKQCQFQTDAFRYISKQSDPVTSLMVVLRMS